MTDNPLIRIYVSKEENRITFKIKAGYYLELLTFEKMKLLKRNDGKMEILKIKMELVKMCPM